MLSALDSEEAINAVPRERLDERAPEEEDEKRDTLLCRAARLGKVRSVDSLLRIGARSSSRSRGTALIASSESSAASMLRREPLQDPSQKPKISLRIEFFSVFNR